MEIQEFAPLTLLTRVGFAKTQGYVLDRRGALGQAMADHFDTSEVSIGPTNAEAVNSKTGEKSLIGVAQAFAHLTSLIGEAPLKDRMLSFFGLALANLESPSVTQLDVRATSIAQVNSFDDLRDHLVARFSAGSDALAGALGERIYDAGWAIELGPEDHRTNVQFGAMEQSQLAELVDLGDSVDDRVPPNVLFVSVALHVRHEQPVTADVIEWVSDQIEKHEVRVTRICDWLGST